MHHTTWDFRVLMEWDRTMSPSHGQVMNVHYKMQESSNTPTSLVSNPCLQSMCLCTSSMPTRLTCWAPCGPPNYTLALDHQLQLFPNANEQITRQICWKFHYTPLLSYKKADNLPRKGLKKLVGERDKGLAIYKEERRKSKLPFWEKGRGLSARREKEKK